MQRSAQCAQTNRHTLHARMHGDLYMLRLRMHTNRHLYPLIAKLLTLTQSEGHKSCLCYKHAQQITYHKISYIRR